jgi:DNA modification methylase
MTVSILTGDCREQLRTLADGSVNCIVTSPPYYGLRDYGMADQIGLEQTPDAFVAELVAVFREARRVLADDGTLWLNLGDSYNAQPGQRKPTDKVGAKQETNAGSNSIGSRNVEALKPKDLIGIPWRVGFSLQTDGWYLRQDIIWHKPNPMPESVTDRCTKSHEYVFLLSKSARYYYDADAIAEPSVYGAGEGGHQAFGTPGGKAEIAYGAMVSGKTWDSDGTRNKRSVWSIVTKPYSEAHFATMPPELADTCIKAGCPKGGTVLDPFGGAGTTGLAADRLNRNAVLIELNPEYATLARNRIAHDAGMFGEVA